MLVATQSTGFQTYLHASYYLTGFRAVLAPVTGDEPLQIFSAVTLLADRLGQCAIGDKPLQKRWTLQALPYFMSTGTVHVVTMPAIAGTGFEPVASRL